MEVHPITQLTNSFLGLMLFPWTELVDEKTRSLKMVELYKQGWPEIAIELDDSSEIDSGTLHGVIGHLRNSICHQRFQFSSENTNPDFVKITFEDARGKNARVNWRATIMAADLKAFCTKFIELVRGVVG